MNDEDMMDQFETRREIAGACRHYDQFEERAIRALCFRNRTKWRKKRPKTFLRRDEIPF